MVFKRIGAALKSMPRIVSIREKTLMDYRRVPTGAMAWEAGRFLSDREAVILLLWALISPAMGLAYIIWTKYHHLRWVAIPLVILSAIQFMWQWRGITGMVEGFLASGG
ncbi:Uncharacterised protein [Candidatus Norongarragalina meridionalis]|nr:Uncharacterised protein [Candidatus Norongarragalina meridionalis]